MDIREAINSRHSVRAFKDIPLDADAVEALKTEIETCNSLSGLHIQLITEEPEAFSAGKPGYGKFRNCRNYLALTGPKGKDEEIGYWGERIVLCAQSLGINSCWVALTYKKGKAEVDIRPGEKLYMVVALGYGETAGTAHRGKKIEDVSNIDASSPDWFREGVKSALLAPTAINQQKFRLELKGDKVSAKAGLGPYTKVDLGIVKYHFEIGSGKDSSVWL